MPAIHGEIAHLTSSYGAWLVAVVVGLESMGIPLPGETTLIAAALYAGTTGQLSIVAVVAAAATGAITGDNVGFAVGRELGYRWLLRHGAVIHVAPRHLKLGQYLFMRHGWAIVFFGRFVAVLRALAAFLAGVNRMRWPTFVVWNAAGAIVWASIYGFGAYRFGQAITRFSTPMGIALMVAATALIVAGVMFVRRNEQRLEDEAEHRLPGPRRP